MSNPIINLQGKFGLNLAFLLVGLGFGFIILILTLVDFSFGRSLGFIIVTSPLWLPITLFLIFFESWLYFVRKEFDINQGRVSLEIKFPQDIYKSPQAMELVLIQLHQTASPDNHVQTYWGGKHPPVYGLEIISDSGRIRFILNVPRRKYKNIAEAHLYAQYPGIEIIELPVDYTAAVPWDEERFDYFSLHFRLKQPSPYPIKTYIDYGLDKDPKEELKIDPMTSMVDTLGICGKHERIWMQILISAHRKENFEVGSLRTKPDWQKDVQKIIDKLAQRKSRTAAADSVEIDGLPRVTPGERDTIAALERNVSKYAFNTTIRSMYIAEKGHFDPGERIGAIITSWHQYDDITRNQIGVAWRTDYDWNWWQDPTGKKRRRHKKRELFDYKRRVYFHQNSIDDKFIMTTEELATMFHPAGQVILAPTLDRIPSTRAEAPPNLPRGNNV